MFQPSGSGEIEQKMRADAMTLSPLEWRVVLLATRDADRGRWAVGDPRFPKIRRFFELLTGTRRIQRLADERLEKLRKRGLKAALLILTRPRC